MNQEEFLKDQLKQDTMVCLNKMLELDGRLYEQILDTPGFAYYFNVICLKSKEHDKTKGITK